MSGVSGLDLDLEDLAGCRWQRPPQTAGAAWPGPLGTREESTPKANIKIGAAGEGTGPRGAVPGWTNVVGGYRRWQSHFTCRISNNTNPLSEKRSRTLSKPGS